MDPDAPRGPLRTLCFLQQFWTLMVRLRISDMHETTWHLGARRRAGKSCRFEFRGPKLAQDAPGSLKTRTDEHTRAAPYP